MLAPCLFRLFLSNMSVSHLQENKHFEDAFQAYEKGVALFKHPHSKDIWAAYLTKFVVRYGGRKLERARDLFRHALREAGFSILSCA